MLSVAAQDIQPHHQIYYAPYRSMPHRQPEPIYLDHPSHHPVGSMGSTHSPPTLQSQQDAAVAQALEIARESPDGAQDPTVSKILEQALSHIWARVQAQPSSYIMTRDEFAVFNFFQHRFAGNRTAIMARKRYWDQTRA
ncbi:hypothetical protein HJFPF1_03784 [Paramyrothecium foliicola]|nr:hypothetical protein HJFPF1_03784 [Paramyrothecium foliicola]